MNVLLAVQDVRTYVRIRGRSRSLETLRRSLVIRGRGRGSTEAEAEDPHPTLYMPYRERIRVHTALGRVVVP